MTNNPTYTEKIQEIWTRIANEHFGEALTFERENLDPGYHSYGCAVIMEKDANDRSPVVDKTRTLREALRAIGLRGDPLTRIDIGIDCEYYGEDDKPHRDLWLYAPDTQESVDSLLELERYLQNQQGADKKKNAGSPPARG